MCVHVNQQMRTGMNAVSQIGDRRGTLERCREGKGGGRARTFTASSVGGGRG